MPAREAVAQEARGTRPSGARRGGEAAAEATAQRPRPAARPRTDSPRPGAAARGAPGRHHRTSPVAAAAPEGGSAHPGPPPPGRAPPTPGRRRRAGALRKGGAARHRLRAGERRGRTSGGERKGARRGDAFQRGCVNIWTAARWGLRHVLRRSLLCSISYKNEG